MAEASTLSAHEPAVFGTSIETLVVRVLGSKRDAAFDAKLRALNVDLDNLQVAYDFPTWHAVQSLLVETIFPGLPAEEAHRRLGIEFVRALDHTLIGKAIVAASRVLGPRRTLERMTRNVRSVNNYIENRFLPLADGTFRLEYFVPADLVPAMLRYPPPSVHYFHGTLEGALELSGAKNATVALERNETEKRFAVFRITLG